MQTSEQPGFAERDDEPESPPTGDGIDPDDATPPRPDPDEADEQDPES
jgi:hypothetical protein